jgi:hypothetical protein
MHIGALEISKEADLDPTRFTIRTDRDLRSRSGMVKWGTFLLLRLAFLRIGAFGTNPGT